MKRILVFPTWVIARIVIPVLPLKHPWYKKRFKLKDWAKNSTDLNNALSMLMWVGIMFNLLCFYYLIVLF